MISFALSFNFPLTNKVGFYLKFKLFLFIFLEILFLFVRFSFINQILNEYTEPKNQHTTTIQRMELTALLLNKLMKRRDVQSSFTHLVLFPHLHFHLTQKTHNFEIQFPQSFNFDFKYYFY